MPICEEHNKLVTDIAIIKERVFAIDKRINGSIDDIHDHIKSGQGWRNGIIGLAGMLILQIILFAAVWGKVSGLVEVNTKRVDRLEQVSFINDRTK